MSTVIVGASWCDGGYSELVLNTVGDFVEVVDSLVGKGGGWNYCADDAAVEVEVSEARCGSAYGKD